MAKSPFARFTSGNNPAPAPATNEPSGMPEAETPTPAQTQALGQSSPVASEGGSGVAHPKKRKAKPKSLDGIVNAEKRTLDTLVARLKIVAAAVGLVSSDPKAGTAGGKEVVAPGTLGLSLDGISTAYRQVVDLRAGLAKAKVAAAVDQATSAIHSAKKTADPEAMAALAQLLNAGVDIAQLVALAKSLPGTNTPAQAQ